MWEVISIYDQYQCLLLLKHSSSTFEFPQNHVWHAPKAAQSGSPKGQ